MTVTTNYGFHQAQPSDEVDITAAVATPLQQVDTQLKAIEDAAAQVANNETVTGTWTFSTNPVLNAGAIAYAKLNLTGGVVNADVNASAAIAKSKLASLAIVDADVSAISESKVTNLTSDLSARLVAANNLSDVADVETSKANLRIPILRSVQAVATSNLTLSGTQTVDSYAAVANDRILATAQSTASQNGVWVVQSGAWTRPNDFPAAGAVLGRCVEVNGGTVYGGTLWILIATATITIDTTAQTWQLVGVSAGTGLTKTGNTLAVNYGTTGTTATVGNDSRVTGAEQTANKGAVSGYMGLDASQRGSSPPKTHDHSAAGDQAGLVSYASLSNKSVALADASTALLDAIMPWRIDIVPQMKDALAASVGTWIISNNVPQAIGSAHLQNSPTAQNDAISIDVVLAKGTWKMLAYVAKLTSGAIITATLGGSALSSYGGSADTFDTYAAATSYNNLFSSTGIVIATTGKYRLTFTMATRNASDTTGWNLLLAALSFVRTA